MKKTDLFTDGGKEKGRLLIKNMKMNESLRFWTASVSLLQFWFVGELD